MSLIKRDEEANEGGLASTSSTSERAPKLLNGEQYQSWAEKMRIYLSSKKLWRVTETSRTPEFWKQFSDKIENWEKDQEEAMLKRLFNGTTGVKAEKKT